MEFNWDWEVPISVKFNSNSTKCFKFIARAKNYIHLYLPQILIFLNTPGNEDINNMSSNMLNKLWFSSNLKKIPINWDLPIDVNIMLTSSINLKGEWEIILHSSNYSMDILPIPTSSKFIIDKSNIQTMNMIQLDLKFLELHWLNKIKESCYIINGNSNLIMKMSKNDTNSWWVNGIIENDFNIFNKFFNRIVINGLIKNLPLFIHVNNSEIILRPKIENLNITINQLLLSIQFKNAFINQISIPGDSPLIEIYKIFKSIDLSLHIFVS